MRQAHWAVAHAERIHYAEIRPIPHRRFHRHRLPLTTDCSGFVTSCYFAAGASDPNGLAFNGEGYTGTLLSNLPHIHPEQGQPGDLVVFGTYPGMHVVMLLHTDEFGGWIVASHGQERGPLQLPLADEMAGFPDREITWLRGVPASHPQAPAAGTRPDPDGHTVWEFRDIHGHLIARTDHPGKWGLHRLRRHDFITMHRRSPPDGDS
ncbi:MAG: hypothetical protein ACTHNU_11615 [Gaiellales bacterium]